MPAFYEKEELARLQKIELNILEDFKALCERHHLTYFGIAGTILGAVRHGGFIPWDDDIDIAMPRKDFERFIEFAEKELSDRYFLLNTEHDPEYPLHTTRLCLKGTSFIEEAFRDAKFHCGIFLDLYPYDNLADGPFAYKLQIWRTWFYSKILILRTIEKPYIAQTGVAAKVILAVCKVCNMFLKGIKADPLKIYWKGQRISRKYNKRKTKRIGFPSDTDPEWNTLYLREIYPLKKVKFENTVIPIPRKYRVMLQHLYGDDYMTPPPEEKRKTHYPHLLEFPKEDLWKTNQ